MVPDSSKNSTRGEMSMTPVDFSFVVELLGSSSTSTSLNTIRSPFEREGLTKGLAWDGEFGFEIFVSSVAGLSGWLIVEGLLFVGVNLLFNRSSENCGSMIVEKTTNSERLQAPQGAKCL